MKQVYVHGLGQTPASWEETVSRLNGGEPAVCLDLAGMVRGKEAGYENLYQAFSAACDGLGGGMDLCGLSLGSVLALNYAIDHPERVRSLALIAPQYQMPKGLLRLQNLLFRLMPGRVFQQAGFGKTEFIRLCGDMAELDFSGSLQTITCPVLVVCGGKDTANKRAAVELAGKAARAELQILEGVGHEVNTEAPETLARLLRDFYGRLSQQDRG